MTNQESNQQQYPQNYPPYEDEINLIDYLRVLWKWKWLIVVGTIICAVAASVISLQMPKIYKITTVIEPGIAGIKDDGDFMYIDSVANISGKINGDVYSKRIQKTLNLDPLKTEVKFKSGVVKKANLIKVTSQWEEGGTDLGMKVTGQLVQLLSNDYEKIVKQRKGDYDKQIFTKQNGTKKLEARRESLKKTLKNIRQRIHKLEKQVDDIKNNTGDMITQRNLLLKKYKAETEMPLLLYSTTIQQNISYFNQINNQIYNFKEKEEGAQQEIKNLEKDINTAEAGITALKAKKGLIGNIKVIQEPEVSLHPVKPKKKQIVLLTTVVALFMAVFLAFFIEYIKNASKPSSANKRT
ncbi:MAG: GNVR domain-containing protein [Thermodesulfobacteriota bacterium]|nr:GNVR domain-containing protein [Thermodesulfobacteriota bacterium]